MKYFIFTAVLAVVVVLSSASFAQEGKIISQQTKLKSVTQNDFVTEHSKLPKDKVTELQKALAAKGFYTGGIDGSWGKGTDEAVRAWQTSKGTEPNGVLLVSELEELGVYMSGTDAAMLGENTPVSGTGVSYGTATIYEYETRTIEKVDIRKHGNGPHARGKAAFMD